MIHALNLAASHPWSANHRSSVFSTAPLSNQLTMTRSSSSPSPKGYLPMSPRSDTSSPCDSSRKSQSSHFDATHDFDAASSASSNPRSFTPSDFDDDADSDHEQEQVKLPSIREFWSGRLPSEGSSLDSSIRELGIGKPLPPRESVRMPHEKSGRGCPLLVEPDTRAHAPRAFRTLSQPTLSPAIFRTGSPMEIENWRPAHAPTKASRWSNASSSSRSGSPYHDGAYYRTVSRARWTSADSDSEDGHHASSHYRRSQYHEAPRPTSGYSHRSSSIDSDRDMSFSRRSSLHSAPSSDRIPSRHLHSSTPSSDHDSVATDDSNWENHVQKAGRLNGAGPVMYTCRWLKQDGHACNYTGKKQLAKRHVDSVHLGKKPHVCPECRKPFPQKTSLDIHIRSVHTFDKPLKCDHCPASFSDPARRHKHYRVEHPDKVVKKPRMKIDFKDIEHLLVK